MQTVDLSDSLGQILRFVVDAFNAVILWLNSIYVFPHVTLLGLLISITVISILISSIFVLYDGDHDD